MHRLLHILNTEQHSSLILANCQLYSYCYCSTPTQQMIIAQFGETQAQRRAVLHLLLVVLVNISGVLLPR